MFIFRDGIPQLEMLAGALVTSQHCLASISPALEILAKPTDICAIPRRNATFHGEDAF